MHVVDFAQRVQYGAKRLALTAAVSPTNIQPRLPAAGFTPVPRFRVKAAFDQFVREVGVKLIMCGRADAVEEERRLPGDASQELRKDVLQLGRRPDLPGERGDGGERLSADGFRGSRPSARARR
jgi:hypothetical protein